MSSQQATVSFSFTTAEVANSVKSFLASKHFVKSACRVSLLNILYHRLQLNEKDFVQKKYDGIPFQIFKRRSKDPIIRDYHAWIKGILDAIDKSYLKHVYLFMREKDTDKILESYDFQFHYNKDVEVKKKPSAEQDQMTKELLNFLLKLKKCSKLENVCPCVELTYYDDAPVEYQPPNFELSKEQLCETHKTKNSHMFVKYNTGYHKMKGTITGKILKTLNLGGYSSPKTINAPKDIIEITSDGGINDASYVDALNEPSDIASFSYIDPLLMMSDEHESDLSQPEESCWCQVDGDFIEKFICKYCRCEKHTPCNGYLQNESQSDGVYICNKCNPVSLKIFESMPSDNKIVVARVRLAIALLHKTKELPEDLLKLLNENDKTVIINQLCGMRVLVKKANKYNIDQENLENKTKYFFTSLHDSESLT